MRVLVIPEDFRHDQYIVKPIIKAMLDWLERPKARVEVLTDPNLGGIDRALDWDELQAILDRYRMVDLFLLCVDRDGRENRRQRLAEIETLAAQKLGPNRLLLAENAWQELEVWALAGVQRPPDWSWAKVRAHRDPKEAFFNPLAQSRGLSDEPGAGRRTLGFEAAANYKAVRQLCSENVQRLEERIASHLGSA